MHPGLTSQPDHQSPRSRSLLASLSPGPVGLEAPSRRSALPFPLPGRPGAFPTTALFAECIQSGACFGAPNPKEPGRRRGRSQEPAPALLCSSPEDKLRGSRCPAAEELEHEGARHGELTARPKVGSAGAGGSEEKGGRAEVGAAEVEGERDPKGSPQCPGATPSPLEDPGTMPKFGGNWGQCPVVFLDTGAALPTSWPPRSVRCVFGAHTLFQNLSCLWDTVGEVTRPIPVLCAGREAAESGPRKQ